MLFGRMGVPIVDVGREALVPYRILNGEKIFQDIFCLFTPFAYYFNALMYKIFGVSLNTLYYVGGFLSYFITLGVYLISKEFLNKNLSFLITLYVIAACIYMPTVFNFIFPYSYSLIWAILGLVFSVYFLIKYSKGGGEKYAYLASFFFGLSAASKYEYIPYVFILGAVLLYFKPIGFKKFVYCILYASILPALTFLVMLFQQIPLQSLVYTFEIINNMVHSKTLKYFYTNQVGTYFDMPKVIYAAVIFLKNIFYLFLSAVVIKALYKIKSKIVRGTALFLAWYIFLTFFFNPSLFLGLDNIIKVFQNKNQVAYLGFLLLFLLLYNLPKNIGKNKTGEDIPYLILLASALVACLKNFFFFNLAYYASCVMPLCIIALCVSLLRFLSAKDVDERPRNMVIIFILFFFIFNTVKQTIKITWVNKPNLVSGARGKIYVSNTFYPGINEIIDFVENQTRAEDKFVIIPEGQIINFLTDRKAAYVDNYNPHYFESFGEENIIKYFKEFNPEYIALTNREFEEYTNKPICMGYAINFCTFVETNYVPVKLIDDDFQYLIFKRKDLK